MQSLKDAINTPHTQYPAPLDTNPATLQKQLSKMKENINHLQQMKRPNVYLTLPGNYRSFCTTDGLVICWRCNQVGHFACACQGNLPPPRAATHYQNDQHNYVPPATSQYPRPSHTPNRPSNQYYHALSRDHTPINTIPWAILTREMPTTPILCDDHYFHPPIKLTASTKLEDLIFQAKTTIIVT